jgi:succinoglycan biosynthesis transport protein ExoP
MELGSTGLQDYFALLRRRRSNMFFVFATLSIAVVFSTLFIDDQYRSTATIAIERPEIPENMVRTTVTYYDTDLRIDRIRDRVLAGPNIETWIREFNLYQDLVADVSIGAAVAAFRKDVEVITIQAREDIAVKNQGETIAFDLSYYGESPAKAVAVANKLANQFLQENSGSRHQSVEETLAFFQRDSERLAKVIDDAEANLANFKERHAGALPESRIVNMQMLDRRETELEDVEREIRELTEASQILETELSKESPNAPIFTATGETILAGPDRLRLLQQQFVELSSKYGPEHPDVVRTRREIELLSGADVSNEAVSIRQELEITRREFEAARQRYTSDHPDVRTLANKIDFLEAQLASAGTMQPIELDTRPDNPAYISLLVQIEAKDAEILALRQRARSLRQKIARYEALLIEAPQVEREYLALQREYDQAVQEFNEVREKQTDAQQARDLEISDKGERYVLQRSPSEPTSAAFPNRIAIIILGLVFAMASALGAAVITEGLDIRVRSIRDLKRITGIPPIAAIPILETQAEHRRKAIIWSSSVFGVASVLFYLIAIQI